MRTLYLDCSMGAAGDMLMAALFALLPEPADRETFVREMNHMGIPGVTVEMKEDEKCGVKGIHASVKVHGREEEDSRSHTHGHHHADLKEIEGIIQGLAVSETVKGQVSEIYRSIAGAESEVHGREVAEVHFHEVGMMDALADIAGTALLMEKLKADQVLVSPVNVGFGQVRCAHGILPVPAPAAAILLRDIPCYAGSFEGELCTPTGAALLRYYGQEFTSMPQMRIQAIGYGTGKRDLAAANVVRAMLGETAERGGQILELCCNLDDMTGEEIGYAMERLWEQGALEVFTIPVGMKKSRPGVLLSVFCPREEREKFAALIFRHTSTIGLRERVWDRMVLHRREYVKKTSLGEVRVKESSGYGVKRWKPEYEDLRKLAALHDMSIAEVRDIVSGEIDDEE